jgi:hypothetical protein
LKPLRFDDAVLSHGIISMRKYDLNIFQWGSMISIYFNEEVWSQYISMRSMISIHFNEEVWSQYISVRKYDLNTFQWGSMISIHFNEEVWSQYISTRKYDLYTVIPL